MKHNFRNIGIFVLLIFPACSGHNKHNQLQLVDIESNVEKMEIVNMSQFTDDIRYVPFEFKEDFSFTNFPKFDIEDNLVIISNYSICMLYDIDGKFINKIGSNGRGPGEYQYITDLGLGKNKKIYISGLYDILEYNTDGSFVNKYSKSILIKDKYYLRSWHIINDSLFLGHMPNTTGQVEYKAMIINKQGKVMHDYKNYILVNREHPVAGGFEDFAHIYQFNGSVFYKELYNDTLFSLNDKYKLIPRYFLNLGKFKMPASDRAKFPIGEIVPKYIFIFEVFQTDNYLFLRCDFGNRSPAKRLTPKPSMFPGGDPVWINTTYVLGLYNKHTGELIFCKPSDTDNPLFTSGIYNDIDCGPRFFPKMQINDSTMVMWIKADELKTHVASNDFKNNSPKFPEKKKQLEDLANNLTDFDNPILMLVTIKK